MAIPFPTVSIPHPLQFVPAFFSGSLAMSLVVLKPEDPDIFVFRETVAYPLSLLVKPNGPRPFFRPRRPSFS